MKTTFFKPIFSLSAIALAVFGAFAFTPAPEKAEVVDIWGLIPSSNCAVSTVKCGNDTTKPFCKSGSVELFDMNEEQTDCSVHLYRLQ
ncbi:DUF6520 domain-containing protein [Flavobacterium sinopsychrotolerans]|jgi:hypothetical protein|uniref:Uncharacterized protein n=3 Tax=Flavobacterium TaxID=237 RepID=A0A1M5Q6Z2_9FLAO|nr:MULTISPECIES: DUF6520 family protein [Flavobacterium]PRZ22093.1 hypothetical protein BC624_10794 [Flavobacterium granuli]TDD77210.1 hypothetical protein E0F89_06325 [Flavobacterium caseinilyticum]SEO68336.1 hypothetical protein SAMN04487942_0124 [Flavobacterium sinopsychrotolerans]SHH09666.1 hypothetical protein SAMN05443373_10794 [Flavobacterium granuli]